MGNRIRPEGDGWEWGEYRTIFLGPPDAALAQTLFEECLDFSLLVTDLPPAADEGDKLFSDLPPGKEPSDKTIFGLLRGEKLVGVIDSIIGYPTDKIWFIGLFLLHPACRGSGIGGKWLRAYEKYARENGAEQIRLGVVEQNAGGRAFWEHNGFVLEARRPPVRYGNRDNIVLVMKKGLRQ